VATFSLVAVGAAAAAALIGARRNGIILTSWNFDRPTGGDSPAGPGECGNEIRKSRTLPGR